MQNMTRGNLYLNLTFDVVEGNITVKAEINTDSYNPDAFLALQFDSDANGTIDIRYWPEDGSYYYDFEHDDFQFLLRANNHTSPSMDAYWGWLPDGAVYFGRLKIHSILVHTAKVFTHSVLHSALTLLCPT
jgi:hypothetical protein